MKKIKVKIVIPPYVSIVSNGYYDNELKHNLESLTPETLVFNDDIIDIWQLSKSYWPKSHMTVTRQILHNTKE